MFVDLGFRGPISLLPFLFLMNSLRLRFWTLSFFSAFCLTGFAQVERLGFLSSVGGGRSEKWVLGADDLLYGCTQGGGYVVRVDRAGTNWASFRLPNGALQVGWTGIVAGNGGRFFLTTSETDALNIVAFDSGTETFSTLHTVSTPGFYPSTDSGVVRDANGFLYGTCHVGGDFGHGFLYRIEDSGANWTILHQFESSSVSGRPLGPLTVGEDGWLYGLFQGDGDDLYRIQQDGSSFQIIHTFADPAGGMGPRGLIQLSDGRLMGGTRGGGANSWGVVYVVDADGSNFTVLHSLQPAEDGQIIDGRLWEYSDGWVYGFARESVDGNHGTLFRLPTDGSAFEVFHAFTTTEAIISPVGQLEDGQDGFLYGGSGNGTLFRFRPPPVITSASTSSGVFGQAFNYAIQAVNLPTSFAATGLPSGLSCDAASGLISGTPLLTGTFEVTMSATNQTGSQSRTLTLSIGAGGNSIQFELPSEAPLSAFPLTVSATADSGLPVALEVVSGPGILTENSLTATGVGEIVIRATQAGNDSISAAEPVTRSIRVLDSTRLTNLSVRAELSSERDLTAGFVVEGGEGRLLVRAVGQGLAPFVGSGHVLAADPSMRAYDSRETVLAENDDWSGSNEIRTAMSSVGAFSLEAGSTDAVMDLAVEGPNTIVAHTSASGLALAELYDLASGSGRLVNLSVRYSVGQGAAALVAGFVVEGAPTVRVLIRGIGPTLSRWGVPGVVSDPRIELFDRNQTSIATNDNWSDADLATMAAVGAFALDAGSADAALVVDLPPGPYSVVLSGVEGASGEGLIEVYLVRP